MSIFVFLSHFAFCIWDCRIFNIKDQLKMNNTKIIVEGQSIRTKLGAVVIRFLSGWVAPKPANDETKQNQS
jgi:hypothetical protein